jgi:hypothetical protein
MPTGTAILPEAPAVGEPIGATQHAGDVGGRDPEQVQALAVRGGTHGTYMRSTARLIDEISPSSCPTGPRRSSTALAGFLSARRGFSRA